jgi:hypothetical protein
MVWAGAGWAAPAHQQIPNESGANRSEERGTRSDQQTRNYGDMDFNLLFETPVDETPEEERERRFHTLSFLCTPVYYWGIFRIMNLNWSLSKKLAGILLYIFVYYLGLIVNPIIAHLVISKLRNFV